MAAAVAVVVVVVAVVAAVVAAAAVAVVVAAAAAAAVADLTMEAVAPEMAVAVLAAPEMTMEAVAPEMTVGVYLRAAAEGLAPRESRRQGRRRHHPHPRPVPDVSAGGREYGDRRHAAEMARERAVAGLAPVPPRRVGLRHRCLVRSSQPQR